MDEAVDDRKAQESERRMFNCNSITGLVGISKTSFSYLSLAPCINSNYRPFCDPSFIVLSICLLFRTTWQFSCLLFPKRCQLPTTSSRLMLALGGSLAWTSLLFSVSQA